MMKRICAKTIMQLNQANSNVTHRNVRACMYFYATVIYLPEISLLNICVIKRYNAA
jgi:hypothetical protein